MSKQSFDLDEIFTKHLGPDAVIAGEVLTGVHPLIRDLSKAHQSELQDAVREARITELKKVPTDGPGDPTGEYITERITYLTQKEIS